MERRCQSERLGWCRQSEGACDVDEHSRRGVLDSLAARVIPDRQVLFPAGLESKFDEC